MTEYHELQKTNELLSPKTKNKSSELVWDYSCKIINAKVSFERNKKNSCQRILKHKEVEIFRSGCVPDNFNVAGQKISGAFQEYSKTSFPSRKSSVLFFVPL